MGRAHFHFLAQLFLVTVRFDVKPLPEEQIRAWHREGLSVNEFPGGRA
jgi:hypothetical protein